MRRAIAISSLALAWLCANGVVWNALQLVAWSKMFATYSASMSVAEAMRETLDPAKPCEMCLGIAKAKEETEKTPPPPQTAAAAKFVLIADAAEAVVVDAPRGTWSMATSRPAPQRDEAVRLRPPRVGLHA